MAAHLSKLMLKWLLTVLFWGHEVDRTVSHCLLDSSVIAIRLCPKSENSLHLTDNYTDTRLNQTA